MPRPSNAPRPRSRRATPPRARRIAPFVPGRSARLQLVAGALALGLFLSSQSLVPANPPETAGVAVQAQAIARVVAGIWEPIQHSARSR